MFGAANKNSDTRRLTRRFFRSVVVLADLTVGFFSEVFLSVGGKKGNKGVI